MTAINKQQKACRILDAAGGKLSHESFKAKMGDDWTVGLRGNLASGGQIEVSIRGARNPDLVLTELGRAYGRGEAVGSPRRAPAPVVEVTRDALRERAVKAVEAPSVALAQLARPLVERRDALRGELGKIEAALAALGVGQ
jgi:hypothetical protein